ncbi:hypothetical protein ACQ4LE_003995 [Meloidogyne hapla]
MPLKLLFLTNIFIINFLPQFLAETNSSFFNDKNSSIISSKMERRKLYFLNKCMSLYLKINQKIFKKLNLARQRRQLEPVSASGAQQIDLNITVWKNLKFKI